MHKCSLCQGTTWIQLQVQLKYLLKSQNTKLGWGRRPEAVIQGKEWRHEEQRTASQRQCWCDVRVGREQRTASQRQCSWLLTWNPLWVALLLGWWRTNWESEWWGLYKGGGREVYFFLTKALQGSHVIVPCFNCSWLLPQPLSSNQADGN